MEGFKEMVCYSKSISSFLPLSFIGSFFDIKCVNIDKLDKLKLANLINNDISNILQNNTQNTTQMGNTIQTVNINFSPNIPDYLKKLKNEKGNKVFGCKPRIQQSSDMTFKIIIMYMKC